MVTVRVRVVYVLCARDKRPELDTQSRIRMVDGFVVCTLQDQDFWRW